MKKLFKIIAIVLVLAVAFVLPVVTANAQQSTYAYNYSPRHIATKTANYSATSTDDLILCDASSAAFTVTLPAVSTSTFGGGKTYKIQKIDTTYKSVTISAAAGNTIGGQSSKVLEMTNDNIVIQWNGKGTDWSVAYQSATPLYLSLASGSTITVGVTGATYDQTVAYMIAPRTGKLASVDFYSTSALATSDTSYLQFKVTNLGKAGSGTTSMLASTPTATTNTTRATGGVALAANTLRSMTISGTTANLNVEMGDLLLFSATTTSVLANTILTPTLMMRFAAMP